MERKALWTGGPEVARLCLGTMTFGGQTDEAEAGGILESYLAAGGDFVDTADVYNDGGSERMLGRLLRDRWGEVLLATKAGNPLPSAPGSGGLSRRWLLEAAEASRERLGLETIPLYYLHLDDETTPPEEYVGAIGELLARGVIRHWGLSNFRGWKIAETVRVADALEVARPVVLQPYYHMLNRVAEVELLPACRHYGMGVVPYSGLARGVLTGKYRGGAVPEGSRAARSDQRMMETEFRPETLAAAERAAEHAEASRREPGAVALRWVLANAIVSSVLIGPKTVDQLKGYLRVDETPYGPEDEAALSALCASGHVPAPQHSDPRYPIRGRVVG